MTISYWGNSCVEMQIVNESIEEHEPREDLHEAKKSHSTSAVKVVC